ncbi:MAG: fibronectin type III domain-containing protein [Flavobacteriaceae bacterium]
MKISKILLILFLSISSVNCSKENTEDETSTPPSAFNLLLVSNNATEVSFTPTLTWQQSTDPNGGSITYDIYLQKANEIPDGELPSQLLKGNITTNTYTLTELLTASTQYKWYVKAKSSSGSTNSATVFSFITGTVINQPPNPFLLLSPIDNAIDVPLDPILTWQAATDPENNPIVYDVYFDGVRIGVNVPNTSLPIGSLQANKYYEWYVEAFDTAGNSRESSTFNFTTGDGSSGGNGYTIITTNAIPNQEGRFGHQMVNYNGYLWIIGGSVKNMDGTGGEYNDVWKSNDGGLTWTMVKDNTLETGFLRSDEHQAVVFRNEIWVLNGNANTAHKSSDGITWENVPFAGSVSDGTHYTARNEHQAIVFNDRLFIIGGNAGGILKNDVWSTDGIPDPNNDDKITWFLETENAGFEPRVGHQVALVKNKLFLVGGSIQGGQRQNDVWSTSTGDFWKLETPEAPFTKRTQHVLVTSSNGFVMFLFGGDGIDPDTGNTVTDLNDVWHSSNGIDWLLDVYHDPNEEPLGREQFDVVLSADFFVMYGGKSNNNFLDDCWQL